MTIIDSDYFINVIEFMPAEQLMQMRLIRRVIDDFINILSEGKYSAKVYILRMLGTVISANLTKRVKSRNEDTNEMCINFYYWTESYYDFYQIYEMGKEIIVSFNGKTLFCDPCFNRIRLSKSYNVFKVIRKIFEERKYNDNFYILFELLTLYVKKGHSINDLFTHPSASRRKDKWYIYAIREAFAEYFD